MSTRLCAAQLKSLSLSSVGRTWRLFRLEPHQTVALKPSNDPYFVDKVHQIDALWRFI